MKDKSNKHGERVVVPEAKIIRQLQIRYDAAVFAYVPERQAGYCEECGAVPGQPCIEGCVHAREVPF